MKKNTLDMDQNILYVADNVLSSFSLIKDT